MLIRNRTGPERPRVAAVIAAGGTGTRIGSQLPKQFIQIGGKPILLWTVEAVLSVESVFEVIIALPSEHIAQAETILSQRKWKTPVVCVPGGETRQESVFHGVQRVSPGADLIMVHDAVRPFCSRETSLRVLEAAWRTGAAIPGLPVTETIQRVSRGGRVLKTAPREELYTIQTPQCFHGTVLRAALERASREGFEGTDESSVVRWSGHPVTVVEGAAENIKITRPLDLEIAERLLRQPGVVHARALAEKGDKTMVRVGHGIDYHRLSEGRKLILGGVQIPHDKGLEGHSDADALTHAICDALLGAAALGDIGRHFPDSDPAHRDRPSLEFLREVKDKIAAAGWQVTNVDATLLAQRPRLSPYFEGMRCNIARTLGLDLASVSIKATTTEEMNAEGRGEGISAQAIVLLSSSRA